jgi:ATP/maltotriose-dependent transcriptional regulator MalT
MFLEASVAHMITGDMHALHVTASRARTLAEGASASVELLATAVMGEALLAMGRNEEGNELLDRVEPFLLDGDPLAVVEIVGMAGQSSIWVGRYDRAERLLNALVDRARDAGAVASLIYPLAARSHLHRYLGRWHAARADAAESAELAEQIGQRPLLAHSLAAQALAEAALGQEEECRAHAKRSLELCRALGGDAITMYGLAALGHLELSLGRVPEAIDRLEELDRIDRRIDVGNPAIVPWRPNLIEAYVRAGRMEDAERQVERLEELAERTGQHLARVTALRGRALLTGDAGFRDAFEAVLAEHDDEPMPYERARTLYAYGERLRRAKQRAEAREPLREALDLFERLPSRLWAERARAELRATGQSSQHRRAESAAEQLTPHELQVALLVAQGMTNREAAAALFLSPKTIEYHLGQIYRKLDVRSRTQLARLIAMEGPDGEPDEAAAAAFAVQLAA